LCADEVDDVVLDLCRRHPRFRWVTIERLVRRIVPSCERDFPDEPLTGSVRRVAEEQLRYLDDVDAPSRRPATRARCGCDR
jgi:hypothetical protein